MPWLALADISERLRAAPHVQRSENPPENGQGVANFSGKRSVREPCHPEPQWVSERFWISFSSQAREKAQ